MALLASCNFNTGNMADVGDGGFYYSGDQVQNTDKQFPDFVATAYEGAYSKYVHGAWSVSASVDLCTYWQTASQTEAWMQFHIYYLSEGGTSFGAPLSQNFVGFLRTVIYGINLASGVGIGCLNASNHKMTTSGGESSSTFSLNTWYKVKLYAKPTGGLFKVWVDDTLEVDASGVDVNDIVGMRYGYAAGGYNSEGQYYVDDMQMATTDIWSFQANLAFKLAIS